MAVQIPVCILADDGFRIYLSQRQRHAALYTAANDCPVRISLGFAPAPATHGGGALTTDLRQSSRSSAARAFALCAPAIGSWLSPASPKVWVRSA